MTDRARPGLVALYDIRPGNGAGPFLQPRSPHGAFYVNVNCWQSNVLTSASEMIFKFIELHLLKQLISPKLNSLSLLYFACRRKDVHLCFIMIPGRMIFAVLEL